jgi:hypothetical protein
MKTAMTKFYFMILFGLALPVAGHASNSHQIDWSTEDLPDGHIRVRVLNNSDVPMTAIALEGERSVTGSKIIVHSVRIFDYAVNAPDQPLEPGQTYTFSMFGPNPPRERLRLRSVKVMAALFQDGGTWGDQDWIATLTSRRAGVYKFENAVMGVLLDAKASPQGNVSQAIDSLKQQYEKQARSRYEKHTIDSIAEGISLSVVQGARLRTHTVSLDSNTIKADGQPVNNAIDRLSLRLHALEAEKLH